MALVLVIHTDVNMRAMVVEMLTLEGHEVVTAADGREGLRIMREALRPEIVLLDLMMPVLDGHGVMQALRAEPDLRARHAVIIWSSVVNLKANTNLGADWTLALPFTIDQLLDAIERGEQILKSRHGEGT